MGEELTTSIGGRSFVTTQRSCTQDGELEPGMAVLEEEGELTSSVYQMTHNSTHSVQIIRLLNEVESLELNIRH